MPVIPSEARDLRGSAALQSATAALVAFYPRTGLTKATVCPEKQAWLAKRGKTVR